MLVEECQVLVLESSFIWMSGRFQICISNKSDRVKSEPRFANLKKGPVWYQYGKIGLLMSDCCFSLRQGVSKTSVGLKTVNRVTWPWCCCQSRRYCPNPYGGLGVACLIILSQTGSVCHEKKQCLYYGLQEQCRCYS